MDWIAFATMIITALACVASIIISINTLKQNSKMIEESTRPNIVIYKDVYHINSPIEYLIIKNFGPSSAKINSINFNENDFKKIALYPSKYRNPFKNFEHSLIAPYQVFKIPIKTLNSGIENINFDISYSSTANTYNEQFDIQLNQDYGIYRLKFNHKNNEQIVISNTLQELVNRIS